MNSFETVSQQATEISRMVSGLIKYLQQSDMHGPKFK